MDNFKQVRARLQPRPSWRPPSTFRQEQVTARLQSRPSRKPKLAFGQRSCKKNTEPESAIRVRKGSVERGSGSATAEEMQRPYTQMMKAVRTLARTGRELQLEVQGRVTQRFVLDALEVSYPMLQGTIRDHVTKHRRPFLRFFACEQDVSHQTPDDPLPEERM